MSTIKLPPLPAPLRARIFDGMASVYSPDQLRARDLEVARVALEAAAQRLEAQAANIDKLVSRDSWDASASSVRQGACYVRALEIKHE